MKANDTQVGGTHYRSDYQHWDLIEKHNFGYLRGCATKYLCRYRNKNGIQDLEKAKHYLQKLWELIAAGATMSIKRPDGVDLAQFLDCNLIPVIDRPPIFWALFGNTAVEMDMAIDHIDELIHLYEKEVAAVHNDTERR